MKPVLISTDKKVNSAENEQTSRDSKIIFGLFSCLLIAVLLYTPLLFANPEAIVAFDDDNLEDAKILFEQSLKENDKDVVALEYLARIALSESEYDDAEDYIEQAQQFAPDKASVQFNLARIMGAQAQDSSIFSAPGYAKKALKAFSKAAELEPSNVKYRQGLMGFYLGAPSMFGGDEKLAMQEAEAIAKLDVEQGLIAKADVYSATDEDKKLAELYKTSEQLFPNSFGITYNRGFYYQSNEKFELAVADFEKIQNFKVVKEEDNITKYAALYQIGRSSVLSKSNAQVGITALHSYIDTAPKDESLPSMPWAKYRLALLYSDKGEKDIAQQLYRQSKSETKDKSLIKLLKKKIKKKKRR